MDEKNAIRSTRTSRVIAASREKIYRAFTDPVALPVWQAPDEMTAKVHEFELREGGGYRMSLFYPSSTDQFIGKTSAKEDRYTARFIELSPPSKIVEAIVFDTEDSNFSGEMTMTVELRNLGEATEVTISFDNLPAGVSTQDNDTGTRQSLEKLARYVE